jgi:glucan-binding YG repeat protein
MYKKGFRKIAGIALASLLVTSSTSFSPTKAKAYSVNTTLDNHVIFQSFSLFQPYESNMYNVLSSKGDYLKDLGVTDIWLPPAYRSFGMARYMEGYAIYDRYDLGEFNQGPNNTRATKYGTSDELKSMINSLHSNGLKVQEDLVPNQMMGLSGREAVYVKRTDDSGNLFKNPYTTGQESKISNNLYLAYTKGGGEGQAKYGYIKEWNKNYFNGTSLQGQGMGRVMTDEKGIPYRYFGPNNSKNYIPSWLEDAASVNKINTVDGYLAVDGWYAAKNAATSDDFWKPMIINYSKDTGYLKYMAENGYPTLDSIINGNNGDIAAKTSAYISSQPAYGYGTEEKTLANDNSGIDGTDQFLFVKEDGSNLHSINNNLSKAFEFLIGLDIDNSNPTVQEEQRHWMNWMLDTYKFDGFRIDAASHYDKQVLLDEMAIRKQRFGNDLDNHISYIESYMASQDSFENANGNGQLSMDWALFYTLQNAIGKTEGAQSLATLATNSSVNRGDSGADKSIPNWSFTTNHDQEKNRVNTVMLDLYGIKPYQKYGNETAKSFEALYDKETEKKALAIYNADIEKVDKKYAPSNVPSQYAFILTNKGTVPTVFYGDMFKTDASYMAEPTIYNDIITNLLKVRKEFALGNQKITNYTTNTSPKNAGQDLIASVRYGTDANTGVATVIGNNPNTDTTIKVNMGSEHANQVFVDATGLHSEKITANTMGTLTIPVKGSKSALVKGYLGVWVPTNQKAGWVKNENNTWSYVYPENSQKAVDWKLIDNEWYYFTKTGDMKANTWINTNSKWYFVDKSGAMKKGWVYTGNKWYFMDVHGAMKTGWINTGNKWYFLDNSGAMRTGWIYTGGKWYFLYNNGSMAANTTIGKYKLGQDGAWIK